MRGWYTPYMEHTPTNGATVMELRNLSAGQCYALASLREGGWQVLKAALTVEGVAVFTLDSGSVQTVIRMARDGSIV